MRGVINLYKCEVIVAGKRSKGWKFKLKSSSGDEIFEVSNEDSDSANESDSEPAVATQSPSLKRKALGFSRPGIPHSKSDAQISVKT